jgi:hypothetical protein
MRRDFCFRFLAASTAEANARKLDINFEDVASSVKVPTNPEPITLIIDALQSKDLKLFVYFESRQDILLVPLSAVNDALERTGFLQKTAESVHYRFMDFYPRRILNDVELSGFKSVKFASFAFCLKPEGESFRRVACRHSASLALATRCQASST